MDQIGARKDLTEQENILNSDAFSSADLGKMLESFLQDDQVIIWTQGDDNSLSGRRTLEVKQLLT